MICPSAFVTNRSRNMTTDMKGIGLIDKIGN